MTDARQPSEWAWQAALAVWGEAFNRVPGSTPWLMALALDDARALGREEAARVCEKRAGERYPSLDNEEGAAWDALWTAAAAIRAGGA